MVCWKMEVIQFLIKVQIKQPGENVMLQQSLQIYHNDGRNVEMHIYFNICSLDCESMPISARSHWARLMWDLEID